ncbi:MAG TPA: hypothetical protein VFT74_07650 [Isosphaeraceae bacterium]|nr:hypothetical protein [Isosphaeraceae bacterium]
MKDEPRHLHAPDAPPTVMHDPLADETILGRWLRQAMEKGARFWLLVTGVVVMGVAISYLLTAYTQAPSESSEAWMEVMVPGIEADRIVDKKYAAEPAPLQPLLAVADEHPDTPAAHWALIHAAGYLYQEGLRDLPRNRDVAKPSLNRAYDMYEKVAKAAPPSAPERMMALLGMARTLETRGELKEAREQYLEVAELFPKAPEAKHARERAKTLEDPEVKAFYDEFYKQDFSSQVSGPPSSSPLIPGLPADHPPLGSPMFPNSNLLPGNPGDFPDLGLPAPSSAPAPSLPSEPFAPSESAKSKDEPSESSEASSVPADPFAPTTGEEPKR